MKLPGKPSRLKNCGPDVCFYFCLFLGNFLFAGFKSAALIVTLLALGNQWLQSPLRKVTAEMSAATSLLVRSLLGLGLFPFLWLAGRLIAGNKGHWVAGLLIILGFLISLRPSAFPQKIGKPDIGITLLALALVTALTWLPFSKIGFPQDGKYAYRAYFSSDYLKHYAVVEALNEGSMPPPNLYFKGEALHYYWLPYAVPAFLSRWAGSTAKAVFAFSFTVNFLFILMGLKLASRMHGDRKGLALLSVCLGLMPSLEGFYLWASRFHFSFAAYFESGRGYNIDGLTRWLWHLPQIDTLLRALFYTPQHLLSLAFLALFLYFLTSEKERPMIRSLCLTLSLATSFFVGGILFIAWCIYWLGREGIRIWQRRPSSEALGLTWVGYFVLPLCLLGLSWALKMVTFNGGVFFKVLTVRQMIILLGLNFGFLMIGGTAGLLLSRFPARLFFLTMLIVSSVFVLFVRIEYFESDISLKAGLVVILLLALLTGYVSRNRLSRKFYPLLVCLVILPGLLTLILDIRNSADIHNSRFTSTISFEEMKMMEWIRKNVPVGRTVQNFPPARTWNVSTIPAFSGRQMFVGDKMHGQIFQVGAEAYEKRIEALERAISSLPSSREDLQKMGVDYLLWGEDETRQFNFVPNLPVAKRIGQTILFSLSAARTDLP